MAERKNVWIPAVFKKPQHKPHPGKPEGPTERAELPEEEEEGSTCDGKHPVDRKSQVDEVDEVK